MRKRISATIMGFLIGLLFIVPEAKSGELYIPGKTFKARWDILNNLPSFIGRNRADLTNYLGTGNSFGREDRLYYLIGQKHKRDPHLWLQIDLNGHLIKFIHVTSAPD